LPPQPYPPAPRDETADEHFGTRVPDPFRPLEDPDAPATRAWIDAENQLTERWIAQVPSREAVRKRLTALWNYERFSAPHKKGSRYFYFRNDGLQNQAVLYVTEGLDGPPRLLLDPNLLSADGTVALSQWAVSEDGAYVAYGLSDGGSDWTTLRIRDVATGEDLPDVLKWIKFAPPAWTADRRGFYYSRYPEPKHPLEQISLNQAVWYHALGTAQSDDVLIYERPDQPEWGFAPHIPEDGRTLVLTVWQGTIHKNRIYLKDLTVADSPIVPLLDGFDAFYTPLGNRGTTWWFSTDHDAPKGKIIAIDISRPDSTSWRTIVPESAETLDGASLVGGRLILTSIVDASSRARVYELDGARVGDVALPGIGSVGGFDGRSDDPETFFAFTGFTTPNTIWRYDVATGASTVYRQPKVDFDPEDFVTEQVFYPSADGTRVPMFLVHKKGVARDGQAPTQLYGYGGFQISLTPSFSLSNLVWMERGGVYAVANLRGGGEYGRAWHEAGILHAKQNVFDDFIAAAEWLIREKVTSTPRLAIRGGSNGGLLVGACITQRPELFGAAIAQVGVLDMLRYHKFTIGWAWADDYGTVEQSEEMFDTLYAYSPLHNVKAGTAYPATLITTGDHDDRVVPAHSFKFAAALQEAQGGGAPVLIRIETRGGHGAGKPMSMVIDEAADVHAFLDGTIGRAG
jgi:prolyl oligopeptidase